MRSLNKSINMKGDKYREMKKEYSTQYLDIVETVNVVFNKASLHEALYNAKSNYTDDEYEEIKKYINNFDIQNESNVVYNDELIKSNNDVSDIPRYSIPYNLLSEVELNVIKHKHFYTETIIKNGRFKVKEKSWVKIACDLEKPVTTIKSIYSRAINKLRMVSEQIEYLPSGVILPGQKKNGILLGGYSLVRADLKEKPCMLLDDLQKSFSDNKCKCPGLYNEWKELICLKRRKLPNCLSCRNFGSNFYDCTRITISQCVECSGASRSTISKYLKNNAVAGWKEKGKYYFSCKEIKDCGQEVFNKREKKCKINKKLVSAYYNKEKIINEYESLLRLWAQEKIDDDIAREISKMLNDRIVKAKKEYELLVEEEKIKFRRLD